jgi:hypothetical protein
MNPGVWVWEAGPHQSGVARQLDDAMAAAGQVQDATGGRARIERAFVMSTVRYARTGFGFASDAPGAEWEVTWRDG